MARIQANYKYQPINHKRFIPRHHQSCCFYLQPPPNPHPGFRGVQENMQEEKCQNSPKPPGMWPFDTTTLVCSVMCHAHYCTSSHSARGVHFAFLSSAGGVLLLIMLRTMPIVVIHSSLSQLTILLSSGQHRASVRRGLFDFIPWCTAFYVAHTPPQWQSLSMWWMLCVLTNAASAAVVIQYSKRLSVCISQLSIPVMMW